MEMTDVNDQAMKLDYFFDPFCGWCYASAPALKAVAERFTAALTMRPSGLFAGARPIASIADHSWRNAKRIAELTDLLTTFGKHREVLQNSDLYSGPDVVLKALESVRDRATAPN